MIRSLTFTTSSTHFILLSLVSRLSFSHNDQLCFIQLRYHVNHAGRHCTVDFPNLLILIHEYWLILKKVRRGRERGSAIPDSAIQSLIRIVPSINPLGVANTNDFAAPVCSIYSVLILYNHCRYHHLCECKLAAIFCRLATRHKLIPRAFVVYKYDTASTIRRLLFNTCLLEKSRKFAYHRPRHCDYPSNAFCCCRRKVPDVYMRAEVKNGASYEMT